MGLAPAPFPAGGASIFQIVPWWCVWPRKARYNTIDGYGAAVFPSMVTGTMSLPCGASIGQAVFAAMLPIFDPVRPVDQWTAWTISSLLDKSYRSTASQAVVLEHLLKDRPAQEQARIWSKILECAFSGPKGIELNPFDQTSALLEIVGRSGITSLGRLVLPVLRKNHLGLVLSALACLARLGIPNNDIPAEVLLNRMDEECMMQGRWALGFLESGDPDLLTALLGNECWSCRVQALRLAEAFLAGSSPDKQPAAPVAECIGEVLLAHLQQERDTDVCRCMAATLGLALRCSGEALLARTLDTATKIGNLPDFEAILNALLVAQPLAGAREKLVGDLESMRRIAVEFGCSSVRALNRVLMSLGNPSGTARDWLEVPVVILLQMGLLRLPEPVRPWFESPGACPELEVASWILERPTAGLATTFAAAYLEAHPEFVRVLERIWMDAAEKRQSPILKTVGGLLAGAALDCAVSPAELRCSLGHEIGGPIDESPETIGHLLGLLMTQQREVHRSALKLLLLMSPSTRGVAGGCYRALQRSRKLFDEERSQLDRFGRPPGAPVHAGTIPEHLRPLMLKDAYVGSDPGQLLAAISLSDEKGPLRARHSIEWDKPETVKEIFEPVGAPALAASFLEATASPNPASREIGGLMAAGVGRRILEPHLEDQILQRVVWMATHDPNIPARAAGRKAAEALGVANQVPAADLPADPPAPKATPDPEWADEDVEDVLNELSMRQDIDF